MSESGMSQLSLIKEQLYDYAGVLTEVLKADVEIVDERYVRIVGTGYYECSPRLISDGIIYEEVISTGRYVIIQNPRRHEVCERCKNRVRCLEKMEIAYPIILNGEVVGVIGVICASNSQKEHLMENIRIYMLLISKICYFISKKITDNELLLKYTRKIESLEQSIESLKPGAGGQNKEIRRLEDVEREEIEKALDKYGRDTNGKQQAAKMLGIGIATLYRKIN